jgi:threonine/homoserine/homoserine lactone efflux protein
MVELFFSGLLLWLLIAIPVWPIGLLCIQRTLNQWFFSWLLTWLWAATADMVYGILWIISFTLIAAFFWDYWYIINIVWWLFLIFLWVRTISNSGKKVSHIQDTSKTYLKDFFTTFILTILNPATFFSFLAMFASILWTDQVYDLSTGWIVLLWIFLWSLIWWLVLSGWIHKIHHKISEKLRRKINIWSWLILIVFAIVIIWK